MIWFLQQMQAVKRSLKWFAPGLGVKRWLALILAGTTLLGIGIGIYVLEIYRTSPDTWWLPILSYASLRIFVRTTRVLIFGGLGVGLLAGGIWGLNRALVKPFVRPGQPFVDTLTTQRRLGRGPRIVVIGGGHGLSMLLRGLKRFTHNLTAIVTVADDGGSSGRLRRSKGILPPGDLRNCLAALSDDETMITQLFQYRFAKGDGELDGHSFGNIFISALSDITGSFEDAIAESGKVLAINGQVLPSSLVDVKLVGEILHPDSSEILYVEGENNITETVGKINRVWLKPGNPKAYPKVLQALLSADLILIGPGSLFTSILPNLLVPEISAAIRASKAFKIYICNVATQPGETEYFSCNDHVNMLESHGGSGLIDLVVQNNYFNGKLLNNMQWVTVQKDNEINYQIYEANLVNETEPWHHDSKKLASILMDLYQARTGPLSENGSKSA